MSVSFNIKIPEKILEERNVADFGKVQRTLDRDVLSYCESFVPKNTGALIRSGNSATRIGSGVITYSAPYARYQYYGVSKKKKKLKYKGGGLRGAYWFERMKATRKYTLLKDAAIAAGGKACKEDKLNSVAAFKDIILSASKILSSIKVRRK